MLTRFDSPKLALEMGLFYLGYKNQEQRSKLLDELNDTGPQILDVKHTATEIVELPVYNVQSLDGKTVGLGVGKVERGYGTWVVNPDSKFGYRI